MQTKRVLADLGTGLLGGYVGTKVMEPVGVKLYEWESASAREQEDAVRPGDPYNIAARKATEMLGLQLSDQQISTIGTLVFHYGLGMSWGVIYGHAERITKLNPLVVGALTGMAMWAIVDEGMTPLFGLSAPNSAYPRSTHIRAFVSHLVYGVSTAATVEVLRFLGKWGVVR